MEFCSAEAKRAPTWPDDLSCMYWPTPPAININPGINIQNHQPRPIPDTPRMIEIVINATPIKNLVAALSRLIGLPLRVRQPCSICSLPDRTSETFPRSVPQLRQNFPVSGF